MPNKTLYRNEKKLDSSTEVKKIKTYRIKFYTKYMDELIKTKQIFNEAIQKYYEFLLKNEEMLSLTNNKCLTELKKIEIEPVLPIAFKEATIIIAINECKKQLEKDQGNLETGLKINDSAKIKFNYSPVFYQRKKGTYKVDGNLLTIKLFNGTKWKWYEIKLKHWSIPKNSEALPMRIIVRNNYAIANIPLNTTFKNMTPVEQKIKKDSLKICGITLTNTNNFVVCTIIDKKGKLVRTLYIPGANQYICKARRILNRIKKHSKGKETLHNDYSKYFEKLFNIKEFYANYVSRQILQFCISNGVDVITSLSNNEVKQQEQIEYFDSVEGVYLSTDITDNILDYLEYKAYVKDISYIKFYSAHITNIFRSCYKCLQTTEIQKGTSKVKCLNRTYRRLLF